MILKATLPLFHPFVSSTLHLPQVSPEARLLRAARRGGPITLGTPEAPYEPAGRSPLAALEGIEGVEVTVVTRSPGITREIELLAELDRRCSVTVEMMVEPDAPSPRERLEAVARLAAEGIAVRVLCAGADDGEPALRKLFGAAREAGAWDVRAFAAPAGRPRRLQLSLRRKPADALATFLRLRLEFGFPRQMTGRG